jgi:hypothetical protein
MKWERPAFEFQRRQGEQFWQTEEYVSSPPALIIMDETGAVWTLGFARGAGPHGEFAFDVLREGMPTGEFASRIERRKGRIRCYTRSGWKVWNGHSWF